MGAGLAGLGGASAGEESPPDPRAAVEPQTSQQPGAPPPAPSSRGAQVGADPAPVRVCGPASAGRCSPGPWGLCAPRAAAWVSRAVRSPPLSGAGSSRVSTVGSVSGLSLHPSVLQSRMSLSPRALSLRLYLSLSIPACLRVDLCISAGLSPAISVSACTHPPSDHPPPVRISPPPPPAFQSPSISWPLPFRSRRLSLFLCVLDPVRISLQILAGPRSFPPGLKSCLGTGWGTAGVLPGAGEL